MLFGCAVFSKKAVSPLCVGADACISPRYSAGGCRFRVISRSRPQCRAGDLARRLVFAASQGFRDDANIVPYGCGGEVLPGVAGYFRRKAAMHPSVCALRRIHLPTQGRLWGNCCLKGSPVRGCGVERRLRRRKLFLIRQTAVTPFIIACSAIESIGPPFAQRSGLCRFAATQRSQNASVLQHTQRDAGTANR